MTGKERIAARVFAEMPLRSALVLGCSLMDVSLTLAAARVY